MNPQDRIDDENRILRHWTPVLLRSILIAAAVTLLVGLALSARESTDYYTRRFRSVQMGQALHVPLNWTELTAGVTRGDPHEITTLGLVVLTLVPIARVAFTLALFVKERDPLFVAATAYVMAGLVAGILLGRIG